MTEREHIRIAFDGDEDIYKYFDPNVKVKTISDIVDNIEGKIEEHKVLFDCRFKKFDDGYLFYTKTPPLLISFGIAPHKRTKERTNQFWEEINKKLGKNFTSFLWTRNTRAINWLTKMGMKVAEEIDIEGNKITKLICQQEDY